MQYTLTNQVGETYAAGSEMPTYSETLQGWVTANGNLIDADRQFSVTATPDPVIYDLLTPMQFYTSFSITERMKLKALALTGIPVGSALVSPAPTVAIPIDPLIAEIWATYQMSVSANAHVDPNLASTLEALEYLASPMAPTPAVITAARIPQILAGIAQ